MLVRGLYRTGSVGVRGNGVSVGAVQELGMLVYEATVLVWGLYRNWVCWCTGISCIHDMCIPYRIPRAHGNNKCEILS